MRFPRVGYRVPALQFCSGVRAAPRHDQTSSRRVALDGDRLAPERVGRAPAGGRRGEAALLDGGERWRAMRWLLNGWARGEPWARLAADCLLVRLVGDVAQTGACASAASSHSAPWLASIVMLFIM